MIPGKKDSDRMIGARYPGAQHYVGLVTSQFNVATATNPARLLRDLLPWGSKEAYDAWAAAYRAGDRTFMHHVVWGADRDLGDGHYMYGAMDDRYASNAARVFGSGALSVERDVAGKKVLVVGGWDGTECLLMRALGAKVVDMIDEVPEFVEMARVQYLAWNVNGQVRADSLYDLDPSAVWQRYDLVYVPGVLYHLTDLPLAMLILWSALKVGGKLAIESVVEPGSAASARYAGVATPGWNWWFPTANCVERLMHDAGFPDAATVELSKGRGWWVGTRGERLPALEHGAAGFSSRAVLGAIRTLVNL